MADSVSVYCVGADHIRMEWIADPVTDMIADSVVAIITQLEVGTPAVHQHHKICKLFVILLIIYF